jgi:hypothetical protein
VRREDLAAFENLRLRAVAVAIEPELAFEALLVVFAHECRQRLYGSIPVAVLAQAFGL